jgi:hypothetical protein
MKNKEEEIGRRGHKGLTNGKQTKRYIYVRYVGSEQTAI